MYISRYIRRGIRPEIIYIYIYIYIYICGRKANTARRSREGIEQLRSHRKYNSYIYVIDNEEDERKPSLCNPPWTIWTPGTTFGTPEWSRMSRMRRSSGGCMLKYLLNL